MKLTKHCETFINEKGEKNKDCEIEFEVLPKNEKLKVRCDNCQKLLIRQKEKEYQRARNYKKRKEVVDEIKLQMFKSRDDEEIDRLRKKVKRLEKYL